MSRQLAHLAAAVFILIGIVGFFVTGFEHFAEPADKSLLGLQLNPLHNLVHLALGLVGLVLGRTEAKARLYGWLLVIGYGAVAVFGFLVDRDDKSNLLNLNSADNILHIALTLLGLAIALWPRRQRMSSQPSSSSGHRLK
jgi:membrane-bound ClpP family serine protease